MIPIVLFQNFPQILQLLLLIIRWRAILHNKQQRQNHEFVNIIQLMNVFINLAINSLNLIMLLQRWIKIRRKKIQ